MILSTSYLPPVWYINKISNTKSFLVDTHEHFVKQTIRNRCHILSPNGVLTLIVPVIHRNRTNTAIKDIRVANDQKWQRQHWRSLNSCYRRSAYFEFYMDEFEPLYDKEFKFLYDFNTQLFELLLNLLKLKIEVAFTNSYVQPAVDAESDFRLLCNEGLPIENEFQKPYPQVFGYKSGFTSGLSIVDVLFNCGPDALKYLK